MHEIEKALKKQGNKMNLMIVELNGKNLTIQELNKMQCVNELNRLNLKYGSQLSEFN